jgi:hypothetical protein
MKKSIICFFIIFIFALIPLFSEGKEDIVCIEYFYDEECEDCESFKLLLESLEKNLSFLHINQYDIAKYYDLFENIRRVYDAYFGTPIIFVGNEWFYFDTKSGDFLEEFERFVECVDELRGLGGVECAIGGAEHVNFPRSVCVREFYDFGMEDVVVFMERIEDALAENVSFVEVSAFDISAEVNLTLLRDVCNLTSQDFFSPCVFVGDRFFPANESYFPHIISWAKNFSKIGLPCPELTYKGKTICIIFFYTPTCHECIEAKEQLDSLKFKYPLNVTTYSTLNDEGLDLLFKYYDSFNVSTDKRASFAIFIGEKYFYKNSQFLELEEEIKKHVNTGLDCPKSSEEGGAEEILRGFTLLTVLAGGLADGVNPCAFATLVFFIAYLERMRHSKKALLAIGISFSLAVFLGYLFIGFGILAFYYSIEGINIISEYIYLFAGIFAILLAAFNIIDYFRIGKEEKTLLQLPRFLKRRRGRIIRILTEKRGIFILSILAFIVGFAIALLEFVCTGQILFPIMAVIKSASPLKTTALLYLILYNIMFIVPLLLILSFFYIGYASEFLGEMQKKRQGLVKIFTASVLLLAGIYMLFIAL